MTVAIPPVPEQAAIFRFLDHANRRIRRFIRAKQQLIALLEEQKQAFIHQAVTRGLARIMREGAVEGETQEPPCGTNVVHTTF